MQLIKIEEDYNRLVTEKKMLEEKFEIRIKSEVSEIQEYCYKLEKEIRELKSENQYYNDTLKEKDATLTQFSHKISSCQKEIEALRKQLFIAEEAYEKAELRVKEVLHTSGDDINTSGNSHTSTHNNTSTHSHDHSHSHGHSHPPIVTETVEQSEVVGYTESFPVTSTPVFGRVRTFSSGSASR